MNSSRRFACICCALASALAFTTVHLSVADPIERERIENIYALSTKLLCSGVFVIGRDPEEFIKNDLQRTEVPFPMWDELKVDVDRDEQSVTLQLEGYPARKAVYTGCQGCVLLPRGVDELYFEPVQFEPNVPDPKTTAWPMGDMLEHSGPVHPDYEALDAVFEFAFDDSQHDAPQRTRAMVVVHKGQLAGERYAPGFEQDTRHISWSMGKSITAALVGILAGQGHFDVNDPAPIDAWQRPGDPRSELTLAHLLRMSSGLQFDSGGAGSFTHRDNHRFVYFGAPNVFAYSIHNPLAHEPNTVWRYRNCDPLSLGKIIRDTVEAHGEDYFTFPQRALFDKIGARNFVLETDPYGNFIMTGFDYGTARDWARFGLLHLHDGVWNGERLLPEGWVDFIRTPAPAAERNHYGGLFWLNAGKSYEDLPEDMYWPAGHHGQVVMIVPSHDLVVVRLGHSSQGGFDDYMGAVMKRIIATLKQ